MCVGAENLLASYEGLCCMESDIYSIPDATISCCELVIIVLFVKA